MKSHSGDFEMSILVGHKPITEYFHEDFTFVEGRDGSEYKIRVRNNTYRRACFVVSVDGLSVLDGKDAADNSPGYVLKPHESLDIACYKVDDGTGAKFVFGINEQSYAAEIGKGTDNTGVIAMKVYQEKYKAPPPLPPIYHYHHHYSPSLYSKGIASSTRGWGAAGGSFGTNTASSNIGSAASGTECMSNPTLGLNQATLSADDAYRGKAPEEASLGTVFGDAMKWETTTVEFERDQHPAAQMVIYYDSRKNLERRGVRFDKKPKPLPNPFPGNEGGCPTPPGWNKRRK